MTVPRFELDRWMHEYLDDPPRYDLSVSTGPRWTLGELLQLAGLGTDALATTSLGYAPLQGSEELREEVAALHGVAPEDVQITTGASEALAILMAASACPGGSVLLPDPGFPGFAPLTQLFGLEPLRYRLRREDGFTVDPDAIAVAIKPGTRLVIVNSPHNPTGACVPAAVIDEISKVATRVGATLVLDHVYHPIFHRSTVTPAFPDDSAVVIGDLSKALSLPGLRLGWIVDRRRGQRQGYFDLRGYFTLGSSPLCETLATIALAYRSQVLERSRSVAAENLTVLSAIVEANAEKIAWVEPAGGLTAFPWLRQEPDARPFCRTLARTGLLAAPGDCFGHPEHIRLGFGATEPAAFVRAMELLDDLLGASR